jgi:hypothetical protein
MNTKLTAVIISGLVLAGCATGPDDPPPHMGRVKFMMYDHTKRAMTQTVEFFDAPPARPFKLIALITAEGTYHEETVLTEAIRYKARQLGADGVIRKEPWPYNRHLYRADAIVFDSPAPPSAPTTKQ